MRRPLLCPRGLKSATVKDYVVRFLFGGSVTVLTGFVAHRFGATVGGAFLAFPAILPASLTFIQKHDGRAAAIDDAKGAMLATFGLAAFAATVLTVRALPCALALGLACVVWLVVSLALWGIVFGRERPPTAP